MIYHPSGYPLQQFLVKSIPCYSDPSVHSNSILLFIINITVTHLLNADILSVSNVVYQHFVASKGRLHRITIRLVGECVILAKTLC